MSQPTIQEIRKKFRPILRKAHVKRSAIFGSFARGEARASSDVDILIDPPARMTLIGLVGLEQDLSEAIGRKVDVVTFRSLHPLFKKRVERDMVTL